MGKYKKDWWEKVKTNQASLLNKEDLKQLLAKCKDAEERIALLLLYYAGLKVNELLELRVGDIRQEGKTIALNIPEKGESRLIYLPLNDLTKEIVEFVKERPSEFRLMLRMRTCYQVKDFIYRVSDKTLTPAFFRHNRIAKLVQQGVNLALLKAFTGIKNINQLEPYLQFSSIKSKKMAKIVE
jgi:site-specific recombinase XerD